MNAEQFQHQTGVSDEVLDMYKTWQSLLSHWNKKINLVAPSTIHDFWLRHALDSWQVVGLLPERKNDGENEDTKTILDMGAGAGFPGLAMAIALKDKPQIKATQAQITLVEANGKKCNFLRTVIRECALPAKAVQTRVENYAPEPYDVITARAFAPLPKLLDYSLPFWGKDTVALFPKGESWQSEVDPARKHYNFDLKTTPSQTNDQAMILQVTNLRRKDRSGL